MPAIQTIALVYRTPLNRNGNTYHAAHLIDTETAASANGVLPAGPMATGGFFAVEQTIGLREFRRLTAAWPGLTHRELREQFAAAVERAKAARP